MMDLLKLVVILTVSTKLSCNAPVNSNETDDGRFTEGTLTAAPTCPVTTETASATAGPEPTQYPSNKDAACWTYFTVENLASFTFTFAYCHCNFLIGLEVYTWTQLISNSALPLAIHPLIYAFSTLLDYVIE